VLIIKDTGSQTNVLRLAIGDGEGDLMSHPIRTEPNKQSRGKTSRQRRNGAKLRKFGNIGSLATYPSRVQPKAQTFRPLHKNVFSRRRHRLSPPPALFQRVHQSTANFGKIFQDQRLWWTFSVDSLFASGARRRRAIARRTPLTYRGAVAVHLFFKLGLPTLCRCRHCLTPAPTFQREAPS